MALQSRIGTATFEHDGQSITLQAKLENIRRLETATGLDFYDFLDTCESQQKLAELFHYMQINTEETEDEIYDAFFGDVMVFQNTEFQLKVQNVISTLMGKGLMELFNKTQEVSKKKPQS